ncbi:16S rRNA (uracil(1498)-N(3))-methyltransferase [uncultured Tyzzerella sp.]|uniref:16S rRNA (uracil(1498)-N(3))-methyltransferase n=1 Tax=uncultured Tyzzerella sp. TaxID=2321398 RepID=UPI0029430AAF|nr:16S rRNA (uracil(1498)-N(3))-methyltransferase [uncultured Tyzzerella sp.]
MSKFFISSDLIKDDKVFIDGENANHIINALRCKIGEKIEVSSGDGYDYVCKIEEISKNIVVAKIIDFFSNESEPDIKITLYQGLPKSEKMELIIQKCVELGVDEIVPVVTDRVIVKLSGKEDKKITRWNKISEAAAKQSRRGKIPTVQPIISFNDAIKQASKNNLNIIPYEKEQKNGIKNIINTFKGKSIGVFIGPEGGFSEKEIEIAIKNDITPITLGKRILRTETAGFITTAILLYELEV